MGRQVAYLLCATPRSGTTLLRDLLSETCQAGRPQSYYRLQDIGKYADDWGLRPADFSNPLEFEKAYLEAVLRAGAGDTGVFGLRIMWRTVGEIVSRLSQLHPGLTTSSLFERCFGPLVYVHVSRQDIVAQAISLLKAEQGGLWHVAADGSDRQRTASSSPVHYDGRRIAELASELEGDNGAWADFFSENRIKPSRVSYEAVAANPRAEVRKILRAIGRPPEIADKLVVRTRRMADQESAIWAERFRQDFASVWEGFSPSAATGEF